MPNVSWCLDTELASCFSSVRQPGQSPSDADVQQDASPMVTQGGVWACWPDPAWALRCSVPRAVWHPAPAKQIPS